jgi:hypothetical protein
MRNAGHQTGMKPAPILVLIVNHRTPALALQAVRSIAAEVRARGDAHILIEGDRGRHHGRKPRRLLLAAGSQ